MARQCSVCGKSAQTGNQVTTRGKKKYLGGVGTKVTGISRRQFKPNLQSVKIMSPTGGHKHALVCVQCIRSGGVTKVVRNAPFKVPHDAKAKARRNSRPVSGRRVVFLTPGPEDRPIYMITRQDIEKVALLGRLRLSEAEVATMTTELAQIVGYVDQLAEVNTDGVAPMAHAIEVTNVFRADEVTPSLSRDEALANAPHRDDRGYLVPAVLGE